MKRFYREAVASALPGGFGVTLDGKPIRTPDKATLAVPTLALADAIAAEWRRQGDDIRLETLALTRLASTAIDLVATRREAVIAETAKYAGTDLVCYRASEPPDLSQRQDRVWQPLLDWARERYGATLKTTAGIVPVLQDQASLDAYARAVADYDDFALAALRLAAGAAGSLIVALALIEGRLGADTAFAAAELDETFQIEQWGEDPEQRKRRAGLQADLALAAQFVALLKN